MVSDNKNGKPDLNLSTPIDRLRFSAFSGNDDMQKRIVNQSDLESVVNEMDTLRPLKNKVQGNVLLRHLLQDWNNWGSGQPLTPELVNLLQRTNDLFSLLDSQDR